jgi:hypothetical protein
MDRLAVSYGVVIAMIAAGYAKLAWRRLQGRKARSWPVAEGRIELTEVGERNWWDFSAHLRGGAVRSAKNVAAFGYSYHVAGVVYSGTYKQEFEVEEDAWEFARRLKDRVIRVQYNPNKPSVSVLSEPSIHALQQSHPTVPGGVALYQDAGLPTVESRHMENKLPAWRIASWVALVTGAWEAYPFIRVISTHPLNISQARVRLVAVLAMLAVARFCSWMSVLQRRRATQEGEPPHT